MTIVNVPVSEATRQQLRRQAFEKSQSFEEFARTVLEREASAPILEQSTETWIAEWLQWTSTGQRSQLSMDDSRDAIYEGCGK